MNPPTIPPVILLADRSGSELKPLTDQLPVALLPVATHRPLDLALASLRVLDPPRIDVVISAHSERIRRHLESSGLNLNIVLSRGEEPPYALWKRGGHALSDEYLTLRGDMISPGSLADFLAAARRLDGDCVSAVVEGQAAGLWYCRGEAGLSEVPGWPLPTATGHVATLELEPAIFAPLDSLAAFHHSSLAAARGEIPGLRPPGHAKDQGLRLGRGARCSGELLPDAQVTLGPDARVLDGVLLEGTVVIEDQVVVDRDSSICDSVILPSSYIGAHVELRNAIVSGNTLIRVDTGTQLTVTDAFLLSDLKRPEIAERLLAPIHRLVGLLLLVLSLPLWPVAMLAALLENPGSPMRARHLLGNPKASVPGGPAREPFNSWQWNTRIPLLRELPRVLALISGRLRLLGPAPLSPDEAGDRTDDWQLLPDQSPAGLLGPTQLQFTRQTPLEERLLSDAFFVRQRSRALDLRQLLHAVALLFSPRAWRPESQR